MKKNISPERDLSSICLHFLKALKHKSAITSLSLFLLFSSHLVAQTKTVTGSVRDDKGQPLSGVSVSIKGGTTGASTNASGGFTIAAPDNATLVISSVGYALQEIDLKGRATLDIQMGVASQSLNEVVVVGYGQQKKQDLTGSVAVISGTSLKDQPATNIDQKLTGQVAGVQVSQTTGIPGGGSSIQIRGQATFGLSTEPLFVVDGYPLPSSGGQGFSPLNAINPNDIESISILKDASSTAIYGSRGANGVVVITTKRGRAGEPVVNVNSYVGTQEVPQKGRPQLLNAHEYAQFRNEIAQDKGQPLPFPNPEQYGKGTNWYDAILQKATQYNISTDISGGTENSRYSFGLDYLDQEGTVRYTGFKRYGIRMNTETKLGKRIKVGLNLLPSYSQQRANAFETGFTDALSTALWLSPLVPVMDPATGQRTPLINTPGQLWPLVNPLNLLQYASTKNKNFRGLGGTFVEVEISRGLKARYNFNVDYNTLGFDRFIQRPAVGPILNSRIASVKNRLVSFNYLSEALLTYEKSLGAGHRINAVVGYTAQKQRDDLFGINGFYNDDLLQTVNNAIQSQLTTTADVQKWALISYLGRVNYTLKDKYLFTATFRRDGSSRFGANQRYGNFPSGAFAWRASEEKFLQRVNWLSELKLRASYGLGGNFNIGNYAYTSNINRADYAFGGGTNAEAQGRAAATLNNPNLSWEESKQLDAGADIGLFNNRIAVALDFYKRISNQLLYDIELPLSSGFTRATSNVGKVQNQGLELGVNSRNLTGSFTWTTNFNIAFNRNRVLATPGGAPIYSGRSGEGNFTHITRVGHSIGEFFGYVAEGIYSPEDMADAKVAKHPQSVAGSIKYKDVNGNGIIEPFKDFAVIGNPQPDFNYGITNSFSYKGFDLTLVMAGVAGGQILKTGNQFLYNIDGVFNVVKGYFDNRYRSPQDPGDGKTPTGKAATVIYRDVNSGWVEDADYLRIQNLTLGYNLRSSLLKGSKIVRNARLYVSAQNLATFTKYSGANPAVSRGNVATSNLNAPSASLIPGEDFTNYPLAKTITLGVNLTF